MEIGIQNSGLLFGKYVSCSVQYVKMQKDYTIQKVCVNGMQSEHKNTTHCTTRARSLSLSMAFYLCLSHAILTPSIRPSPMCHRPSLIVQ